MVICKTTPGKLTHPTLSWILNTDLNSKLRWPNAVYCILRDIGSSGNLETITSEVRDFVFLTSA